MENQNQTSYLPAEVEQIAQNVSVEKRNEVQNVLNQVFSGVSKMREQLDSVVVENENDKTGMKLAKTVRLSVRDIRLDAERNFDAKRSEVQQKMIHFKTEDSLWLKAKQTMQILTKEIEEQARWKEETKERFDAECRIDESTDLEARRMRRHEIRQPTPRGTSDLQAIKDLFKKH